MKTYCEIIASDFLPAIRALVAKELINSYGMTQTAVARRMGTTQPAISYYMRELRGTKVRVLRENERLMDIIRKAAAEVASGKDVPVEMQRICSSLRQEDVLTDREKLQCCSLCGK